MLIVNLGDSFFSTTYLSSFSPGLQKVDYVVAIFRWKKFMFYALNGIMESIFRAISCLKKKKILWNADRISLRPMSRLINESESYLLHPSESDFILHATGIFFCISYNNQKEWVLSTEEQVSIQLTSNTLSIITEKKC